MFSNKFEGVNFDTGKVETPKEKGEFKSVEIPNVGKIDFSEHFIGLSKARKENLKLQGLEGFKVKKILALPKYFQDLVLERKKNIKENLGEHTLNKIEGEIKKNDYDQEEILTKVLKILNTVGGALDYSRGREEAEAPYLGKEIERKKMIGNLWKIESLLTEGSCPSFLTAQHGLFGDMFGGNSIDFNLNNFRSKDFESISALKMGGILFNHYSGSQSQGGDLYKKFKELNGDVVEMKDEHSNFDYYASGLFTAAPFDTGYHFKPVTYIYGIKNRLFKNYLETILSNKDSKIKKMIDSLHLFSGYDEDKKEPRKISYNELLKNKYMGSFKEVLSIPKEKNLVQKEGCVYVPNTGKQGWEMLLDGKPLFGSNLFLPIIGGYPEFPQFRMGVMAEAIIDFTNQRVILPVSE